MTNGLIRHSAELISNVKTGVGNQEETTSLLATDRYGGETTVRRPARTRCLARQCRVASR